MSVKCFKLAPPQPTPTLKYCCSCICNMVICNQYAGNLEHPPPKHALLQADHRICGADGWGRLYADYLTIGVNIYIFTPVVLDLF